MAPERSRLERSRPESFLPARSAGLRDVAEAMAASTSARVISADAISGDVRSTCCIISCEAPGMAEARPNIAIAPIHHRLALPRRLPPLSGRCSDDKRPTQAGRHSGSIQPHTLADRKKAPTERGFSSYLEADPSCLAADRNITVRRLSGVCAWATCCP